MHQISRGFLMILKLCIEKLMHSENLESTLCEKVLDELLDPAANPLQIAALLVLLRTKGESVDELSAFVNALRKKMISISTDHPVLDIVGTGGDGLQSINISTGSAILAASCGVKIAKHGNRSVSSLTGSADVLEALGVNIQLTPEKIRKSIDTIGIGFFYSPNFHSTTQALKSLRKQLNVQTTFNILGPLLNPADAKHFILGVYDEKLLPIMADVLIQTGCDRSMVVHGMGLDEISCVGTTKMIEVNKQKKIEYIIDPVALGLKPCLIADLRGGDAKMNAHLLLETFKGKRGAIADTLILNAAVASYLYGLGSSISECVINATEKLYNGSALTLLNSWIEFSHEQ